MCLDVERDLNPAGPSAVRQGAEVEGGRIGDIAGHHVDRPGDRVLAGARNEQVSDSVEPVYVIERDGLEIIRRTFILMDILLEFLVDLGPVGALRFDEPVLRVKEDLAIRLPDAVTLHPLPLVPGIVLGEIDHHGRGLQIHQAALDEDLHRDVCLDDACADLARTHLHIDEEVFEQAVDISVDEMPRHVALAYEVGL